MSRLTSNPGEIQRYQERLRTVARDAVTKDELGRSIEAGDFDGELLSLAHRIHAAMSLPADDTGETPAQSAMTELKRRHLNPKVFGVSWKALKRALAYERDPRRKVAT